VYKIYVLCQQKIEISRDISFHERIAFKKSIESNEKEEHEDTNEESTCSPKQYNEEQEPPHESMEPTIIPKTRKRPTWLKTTLQEAKKHKVSTGTFKQSKKPKRFTSYAALITSLVNDEPSTFEEAIKKKEWKKAMMEEYQSIMKNDVWEGV
jgi:hypothetical protein